MKKNNKHLLSTLLKSMKPNPKTDEQKDAYEDEAKKLQLKMLRIQQGVFHKKERVVIMFDGFDAAGKGGAIRSITETLDPRSVKVIPVGAPTEEEKGKPWLYRFWRDLPDPGYITIFDRSWYGRVMVEKVDKLTSDEELKTAYDEINHFEALLQRDGIHVIKFFLAITKNEQLERFQDRLKDPYKQWKIGMPDINARKKWDKYVLAVDAMLEKCNPKTAPFHVIPANSKKFTRKEVLKIVTDELTYCEKWIEKAALEYKAKKFDKMLKE
ncbi:MAG: polyphosphate kinase [Bdellovibrionales bacterium]|nr:polyphosphate kinase [Bdellovibrionales bacterium]